MFTELLETPVVQKLRASEQYAPYLTQLEIFSYGTWASYQRTPNLPPLADAQAQKLRQLSLLTLAQELPAAALTYAALMQALDVPTARELEGLVVGAVYAGLLDARLDPQHRAVRVNSVAPLRDVAPAATAALLARLRAWAARCDRTLAALEAQMVQVRRDADRRAREAREWKERSDSLLEEELTGGGKSSHAGPASNTRHTRAAGGDDGGSGSLAGNVQSKSSAGQGRSESPVWNPLASGNDQDGGGLLSDKKFGKRGSGHMDGSDDALEEDEAMDVDDDPEAIDSKKRASRRKL